MKKSIAYSLAIKIITALAIAGCTTTGVAPIKSKAANVSARKFQEFRVVYLNNNLEAQLPSDYARRNWPQVGYGAFGVVLKKRVPVVFGQSGLNVDMDPDVRQFYTPEGQQKELARAIKKNLGHPLLILQATTGSGLSGTYNGVSTGGNLALIFNADLLDAETSLPIWSGQFDLRLGVGFPARTWVNDEFVDKFLFAVIKQLQSDGVVVARN